MPPAAIACPWCSKAIEAGGLTAGSRVQCPRCRAAFTLRAEDLRAAAVARAVPQPAARPPSAPPPVDPNPTVSGQTVLIIGAGAAGALLLIAGVIVAVILGGKRPTPVAAAPPTPPAQVDAPPKPIEANPPDVRPDPPPDNPPSPTRKPPRAPDAPPPSPPPLSDKPPDLAPSPPAPSDVSDLPADLRDQVNKAIERGVARLEKTQAANGSWATTEGFITGFPAGVTALAGLTLLECGVPADDGHVQKAAAFVRKENPPLTQTYDVALAILFLDRLGDPKDETLLQSFAARLIAGQTAAAGWGYSCPVVQAGDVGHLFEALRKVRPGALAELAPPEGGLSDSDTREMRKVLADLPALPPSLRNIPALQPWDAIAFSHLQDPAAGDNSNTQFGILGLWIARRHDVPAERPLALVTRRFRASQTTAGEWGYNLDYNNRPGDIGNSPSMTAAGLLGLAAGHGVLADLNKDRNQAPEAKEDPAVEKGMKALSTAIDCGRPLGDVLAKLPGGVDRDANNPQPAANDHAFGKAMDLYFLWSVERVGVLFGRRTIADKEWYPWGARLLVDGQNDEGGWGKPNSYVSAPVADTCFALLFLKRANLASDLSTKLQFLTQIKK